MSELIPRNTRIPVKKTKIFTTADDDEDTVTIQIFEGERPMTRDNHFLGSFDLMGLPPGPRGTINFSVTFELDQNNILTVIAEEHITGSSESITINAQDSRLTEEQIEEAIKSADEWSIEDQRTKEAVNSKNKLEQMIISSKLLLNDDKFKNKLNKIDLEKIINYVDEINELKVYKYILVLIIILKKKNLIF